MTREVSQLLCGRSVETANVTKFQYAGARCATAGTRQARFELHCRKFGTEEMTWSQCMQ